MTDGSPLRVLIADDERPARSKLRRFLEEAEGIGTILEAWDGPAALLVIRDERPDLVFLDIQMPGLSGLEVLDLLPREVSPHVVFVTAYDAFAVEAFERAAVDYLLKPWDRPRLAAALERSRGAIRARAQLPELERLRRVVAELGVDGAAPVDRVLVEEGGRRVVVALADVEWIEADHNHVVLHGVERSWRLPRSLGAVEATLDRRRFRRVGRGSIVNLAAVTTVEGVGHGDQVAHLRSGATVRVSRRHRLE